MPNRYTDAFLDSLRQVTDPPADEAVAALLADGQVDAVNQMMKSLVANDAIVPETFPPPIRSYLEQTEGLPAWADPEKIRIGEDIFWRYGPEIIAIFHCYSLPFCYAARKGVQVLFLTARLTSNAMRRITETAQMIVDVMKPGGIGRDGAGIRTAQKVRLMHAGVRRQIWDWGQWNPEFDQPINQEDLAGTLMSFSWVALDGLRQLGFALTAAEQEAYLHCWNAVGHIMGIRPDTLPANMAEAEELARAIQRRQYAECPEGQAMTKSLIEMMQYTVPGNVFDSVPPTMLRFFLKDSVGDLLGVAPSNRAAILLEPLQIVNSFFSGRLHASEPLARVHEVFSRKLIEGILLVRRGGQRIPFNVPTELRQAWGVNWVA